MFCATFFFFKKKNCVSIYPRVIAETRKGKKKPLLMRGVGIEKEIGDK